MVPPKSGYLKRLWRHMQTSFLKSPGEQPTLTETAPTVLSDPLVNYYRHRARTNLQNFYRFAVQTRSLSIRNIFAQVASHQHLLLEDLLLVIRDLLSDEVTPESQAKVVDSFDRSVLLALADLLADTARNDIDTHAAVLIYQFVRAFFGEDSLGDKNILYEVEALHELGEFEQSQNIAEAYEIDKGAPLQSELLHIQRLRLESGHLDEWLDALNNLFDRLGMSRVRLNEDDSLPLMDRLGAGDTVAVDGPKVTVIVPTFSPGSGIITAIRGLLEQTWQNLEIIVVNDASPLVFKEVFTYLENLDPRVRVIHQKQNAGAYVARNAGLKAASGAFITTHDDDDWSHPDKISSQVRPLLNDGSLMATTSAHIRTTENLLFKRVNVQPRFLQMNYSSLMFRKSLVEEIGPWDTVNRGGDSEFYSRLLEFAGANGVLGLHERPLSFSRIWDGSLTSGEMYRGFFGYSRLLYRWAFRQWHREMRERGEQVYLSAQGHRPFPVPTTFEPGRRHADLGKFDVVYVSDFFRQAKSVDQALNEMKTLANSGLRVGYLHLYSPETRSTTGFPRLLFELQLQGKIEQVALDNVAEAKLILVYDTSIGMFLDQIQTKVRAARSIAIEQTHISLADVEPRVPSYAPQALSHLDVSFDTHFEIVGATAADHMELRKTIPAKRILQDKMIWHTHLPESPGEITTPTGVPRVGFHSSSNQYRLPNTVDVFDSVYISNTFTTHFFGAVRKPLEKFGNEVLSRVELVEEGAQTEQEFLRSIDFWVYWPHSRLRDQVWEPVLAAFRAGKVVILPKSLEALYGDAAVYAAEDEVKPLIDSYSHDPDSYIEQARRAQAHVERNYTKESFLRRVAAVMK